MSATDRHDGTQAGGRAQGRTLSPLRHLWPYLARRPRHVAAAVAFLLLSTATTLTLPMAVRRMIDHGFDSADAGFINSYFAMLIGIGAVLAVASAARYYFVIWLGERVVADLRADVFAHVTALSPGFFDTAMSGEIVSRLAADTTQVKSAVGATASLALRNTLLGTGALVMMVATSPRLSLLVIGAIPLILVPLVGFGREVRARSRAAQDRLAEATAYASEAISSIRTVQAFTAESAIRTRFAQAAEDAFRAAARATRTRAVLTALAIFLISASIVAVLWIGARDVLAGTLSPGTLGQFLLYALFAAGALGALSEVWGELAQAAGAAERLAELMEERPAIATPAEPAALPAPARGAIAFEGVTFAYPSRPGEAALDGLDLVVKPGETLAVVGPSGAGKSTLLALLERFYDPDRGTIRLDGIDLRRLDPAALRASIALVPQDPSVFAASALDNIRLGRPDAPREAVIEAARAAHADTFLTALPQGYETPLGERGVALSGGQRQRIAIARAVLRDAPVLLLDEATSALDAESERLVQDALSKLMTGRTTLVIAHRLATVLKADRIVVMEAGRIVESGTHGELVRRGGTYARLAALQFHDGAAAFKAAE